MRTAMKAATPKHYVANPLFITVQANPIRTLKIVPNQTGQIVTGPGGYGIPAPAARYQIFAVLINYPVLPAMILVKAKDVMLIRVYRDFPLV